MIANELTTETTFLGAHVVPQEYQGRDDEYVALVCGEMLARCAPHARWIDAFCEVGAFTGEQCRAVLEAGRAVGLGLRLHGNQLGQGVGVALAVELGCASVDHCTYLSERDVEALSGGDTVATMLPATDFSTRQRYPDARRLVDAGVTVALAANCNPGSSYTTSMPFCIALAVRELGMTADEAILAATAGGAAALRRDDIGTLRPGGAGDLIVLDAASPIDFVYRPGVPIVAMTMIGGEVVHDAIGIGSAGR
jgi:imidazolonepropionase